MWATAEESREEIVALYRRAWAHADATIESLPLDAAGRVPWWRPERRDVTLHRILVHVIAETHRHAGHADIVRELVDGAAGLRADNDNLPEVDPGWWAGYRDRLERRRREEAAALSRLRPGRARGPARCGGRGRRWPSGSSSPSSSKRTTPLHSRLQPCSGWLLTTAARSRASLVASGQGVTWWHMAVPSVRSPARCRELRTVLVRLPDSASVRAG